jgi:hypothetical protein
MALNELARPMTIIGKITVADTNSTAVKPAEPKRLARRDVCGVIFSVINLRFILMLKYIPKERAGARSFKLRDDIIPLVIVDFFYLALLVAGCGPS